MNILKPLSSSRWKYQEFLNSASGTQTTMKHGASLLRELRDEILLREQNSVSSEFCTSMGSCVDGIWRLYSLFRQPVTVFHQPHSKTNPSGSWLSISIHFPVTENYRQPPGSVCIASSPQVFVYIHKPSYLLDTQSQNQKIVLPLIKLQNIQSDYVRLRYQHCIT